MRLNQISDNEGARRPRKRLGRGIGSGLGKTAGRGGKGQTARSGGAKAGFEGGQMPIYRRLPKRGFNVPFPVKYNEINLGRIQQAVDAKKIDVSAPVTLDVLVKAGVVTKAQAGLRLLGTGELKAKLAFEVHHASKGAIAAVEKAGGSVKVLKSAKVENEHETKAKAAKTARLEALRAAPADAKEAKPVKEAKAPKQEDKPAAKAKKEEKPAKAK
ncbi:50S ribosomal protein L15 [Aestuariivirga sp. YIM B02566]|uniref:50S ribosomal protein L15 n=1 Tax=Taklimakanibacter albus TaxID=2800327 RepID=A0ACC5R397_9HYPH|nr:50S ribosomal protein L15 [Aestuariivirga sp. YIM B02566]